tara:strand:+ start:354 stop:638 length:285 start_codon:yes stop_codon:yes gene_type:complete
MMINSYGNVKKCDKCGKEFKESQKDIRDNYGKYFTNKQVKDIIDKRLHEMAALESTLGIDSTDKERNKVRNRQSVLLKEIKEIDEVTFKRLSYE